MTIHMFRKYKTFFKLHGILKALRALCNGKKKKKLAWVLSTILLNLHLDFLYSDLCCLLFYFVKPLLFTFGQNWLHQNLHIKNQRVVVLS